MTREKVGIQPVTRAQESQGNITTTNYGREEVAKNHIMKAETKRSGLNTYGSERYW